MRSTLPQTTGLVSASPESQLFSLDTKTQLTDFFQILKIIRARFWCMMSFTSPGRISYLGFLFWHLWMTHPRRARMWTPALMLHLTNPWAKRKVPSLTKLKSKIYKTKSLGHYITFLLKKTKKPWNTLILKHWSFSLLRRIIWLKFFQITWINEKRKYRKKNGIE